MKILLLLQVQTSGVQGIKVIGYLEDATASSQPTLVVQYINSGSDNETNSFSDK